MDKFRMLAVVLTVADTADVPSHLDARLTAAAKNAEYYEVQLMRAVQRRYEEKTDDSEFLAVFLLLIGSNLRRAYREGLREVGEDGWNVAYEVELDTLVEQEKAAAAKLLDDIKAAILAGLGYAYFRWRIALWKNRYLDTVNRAMVTGGKRRGTVLEWVLGATEKHCTDCGGYAGQKKTAQEWDDLYRIYGHKPQARELQCKGYNCDCRFRVVKVKR